MLKKGGMFPPSSDLITFIPMNEAPAANADVMAGGASRAKSICFTLF